MEVIKKINKEGVIDQVFSQMKENILRDVWKRGEKIPSEKTLAEMFGVSRTSVRMAIQKLVTLGLLEPRVGEGTFVTGFSGRKFFEGMAPIVYKTRNQAEILEFQKAMELGALIMAIDKATDEDVREIEQRRLGFSKALDENDIDRYVFELFEFHFSFFKTAGNQLFLDIIDSLRDIFTIQLFSLHQEHLDEKLLALRNTPDDPYVRMVTGFRKRDIMLCISGFLEIINSLQEAVGQAIETRDMSIILPIL